MSTLTSDTVANKNAVRQIRLAQAQLRRLQRDGGWTAATVNAMTRHRLTVRRYEEDLIGRGAKVLAGLVTGEARLFERVDQRKAVGTSYADLAGRLQADRRRINALTR